MKYLKKFRLFENVNEVVEGQSYEININNSTLDEDIEFTLKWSNNQKKWIMNENSSRLSDDAETFLNKENLMKDKFIYKSTNMDEDYEKVSFWFGDETKTDAEKKMKSMNLGEREDIKFKIISIDSNKIILEEQKN